MDIFFNPRKPEVRLALVAGKTYKIGRLHKRQESLYSGRFFSHALGSSQWKNQRHENTDENKNPPAIGNGWTPLQLTAQFAQLNMHSVWFERDVRRIDFVVIFFHLTQNWTALNLKVNFSALNQPYSNGLQNSFCRGS